MTEKKKPKFLRRDSVKLSKLGKGRKKKQVWRRPTGRHNKMREHIRGHPVSVSVGYKTDSISRGMIEEKNPVYVENVKQLEKLRENEVPVLRNIGMKKKIEIAKRAKELDIKIHNLNINKILKKTKKKNSEGKK